MTAQVQDAGRIDWARVATHAVGYEAGAAIFLQGDPAPTNGWREPSCYWRDSVK